LLEGRKPRFPQGKTKQKKETIWGGRQFVNSKREKEEVPFPGGIPPGTVNNSRLRLGGKTTKRTTAKPSPPKKSGSGWGRALQARKKTHQVTAEKKKGSPRGKGGEDSHERGNRGGGQA